MGKYFSLKEQERNQFRSSFLTEIIFWEESLAALKIKFLFSSSAKMTPIKILRNFLKRFWVTVSRHFHLHIYKGVIRSFPYHRPKGKGHWSRRKMKYSPLAHRMCGKAEPRVVMTQAFKMHLYNNHIYKWSWSHTSLSWDMWSTDSFSWAS